MWFLFIGREWFRNDVRWNWGESFSKFDRANGQPSFRILCGLERRSIQPFFNYGCARFRWVLRTSFERFFRNVIRVYIFSGIFNCRDRCDLECGKTQRLRWKRRFLWLQWKLLWKFHLPWKLQWKFRWKLRWTFKWISMIGMRSLTIICMTHSSMAFFFFSFSVSFSLPNSSSYLIQKNYIKFLIYWIE